MSAGTYTVVACFAGSADYAAATSTPVTFTITRAAPTTSVSDAGGAYDGSLFAAYALVSGVVAGVNTTPGATLESTELTLMYYTGGVNGGDGSATPPIGPGTYMVVAMFPGSADYAMASSEATFTISRAAPILRVIEGGGTYDGSPFPATPLISGVVEGVDAEPSATLQGVGLTCTYYVGSVADGDGSSTPPTVAGTYAVIVTFPGSANYTSATSAP